MTRLRRLRPVSIKLLAAALVVAVLAAVPLVIESDSIVNLALLVLLYMCLASSWNILGGYTGQTNLGHAAFFGIGALVTRTLWLSGWNIFPGMLAGGLAALALALIIGVPAFRLRGVYFAIGTLALGQILYITVGNTLPQISSLPATMLASYQLMPRYYLLLGLAVLICGSAYWLVNSTVGLGLMAVREEEDAAESLGIHALKHKLIALGLSAFFGGLTGGAFAFYHVGYYAQMPFGPEWTFDSMMMAYIGGAGTILGPIVGSIFFVVVRELLALKLAGMQLAVFGFSLRLSEMTPTVFGILFILVVLFVPGGLVGSWASIRKVFTRGAKPTQGAPGRVVASEP